MLSVEQAARDIETMQVRGAGRLARHAVRALRDLAQAHDGSDARLRRQLERAAARLLATRPTAVSLRNGIEEALAPLGRNGDAPLRAEVLTAADAFLARSIEAVGVISDLGAGLLGKSGNVLTHCNSACSTGVIARAHQRYGVRAFVSETRPRHQGRLTARQLRGQGVPVTYLVDSAVNMVMGDIDWVVVGADSIARNGDVVNKVGTSMVALSAREHRVPFYVAAETYKVDRRARTGKDVRIEERDPREVVEARDLPRIHVMNPVFDMTPARFVRRIVTENGAARPADVARLLGPGPVRRRRR